VRLSGNSITGSRRRHSGARTNIDEAFAEQGTVIASDDMKRHFAQNVPPVISSSALKAN
jgi:hypothetical protein